MTFSKKNFNLNSKNTDISNLLEEHEVSQIINSLKLKRSQMNEIIMDYLVKEGYKEAADVFRQEACVKEDDEGSFDAASLYARLKIKGEVESGNIEKAIAESVELEPELFDENKPLHFQLQQQHLIELIRGKRIDEALSYAQSNLCEHGEENSNCLRELEKTLALLAFEEPEKSPFKYLLDSNHRHKVASELNYALLRAKNVLTESKLSHLLKFVSWSQNELEVRNVAYPKVGGIEFNFKGGNDKYEKLSINQLLLQQQQHSSPTQEN